MARRRAALGFIPTFIPHDMQRTVGFMLALALVVNLHSVLGAQATGDAPIAEFEPGEASFQRAGLDRRLLRIRISLPPPGSRDIPSLADISISSSGTKRWRRLDAGKLDSLAALSTGR